MQRALSYLSATTHRGILLDLLTFVLNLVVMQAVASQFVDVIRRASADERGAQIILVGMGAALLVLAPLGATLKRCHVRRSTTDPLDGCLFSPIFYFCLVAVIFAAVNAFILQTIYGRKEPDAVIFVTSIFGGIAFLIAHTVLVYRYFSPPKHPPKSQFLRGPASAILGDAFLFLNMALFQLIWNLVSLADVPPPSGPVDLIFRVLLLLFLALLLYFPPRMFYLAEDIKNRRTWLFILLANSPIIVRVLLGVTPSVRW